MFGITNCYLGAENGPAMTMGRKECSRGDAEDYSPSPQGGGLGVGVQGGKERPLAEG